jgi:tetratricopeptide (TPR) repeat protein
MRYTRKAFIGLGRLAMPFALAGCVTTSSTNISSNTQSHLDLPKPGPHEVLVDSQHAYSSNENRPMADWILERARKINVANPEGFDKLVKRWPDVTLELLRGSLASDTDMPLRIAIAQSYDRQFATSDPQAGWSAVLAASASQRAVYGKFRQTSDEMLSLIHSGRFPEAMKIDAVAALPTDATAALRSEAWRLAGLAAILNNQFDRAATAFSQAVCFADHGPQHPRFEVGLLLSEAERRRGHLGAAADAWKSSVSSAAVRDPELWERAILGKPADANWPSAVGIGDADETNFSGSTTPETADVLISIGKMRLSRGAPQPALLAFSRAEAETADPAKKGLARLFRAQAMIALGQAASVLPMLDARLARRARAVQGDVLCRVLDNRPAGIPLMCEALDPPQGGDWPGKSGLQANLGLYYLLEGNAVDGLRRLHDAEHRFEAEHKWEDLADTLKNEAAFLRSAEKYGDADQMQHRADELCRKTGLPVGPLTASASANSGTDYPKQ